MAALPENIDNLHPQTTREWLQFISRNQQADHDLLTSLINKTDSRLNVLEASNTKNCEAIDTLKAQTRSWNVINSIGIVIAGIISALGLKGS